MDFRTILIEFLISIAGRVALDALGRAIEIARELQKTGMTGDEKQKMLRDLIRGDLADAPGYLVGLVGEAAVALVNQELVKDPT